MVKETGLYDLLGVAPTVSEGDLKKAYRKLALRHHPDKGGDAEHFKKLSFAYEVLSDKEKRDIYDAHGEEGLKSGGGGGDFHDPFDIFNMFFGMGGGRGPRPKEKKGKSCVHQLKVSLEEMYSGNSRKLAIQKNVICNKCDGRGGKTGKVQKCTGCKGTGMKVYLQQLAPGFVSQSQSVCGECSGKGEIIDKKDRCPKCDGKKVTRERKVLEVHIDKGMEDGQKVVLYGEGDQEPGMESGDVVIVLDEQEHEVFKRKGMDLIVRQEIQLVEALCGFEKVIKTLDGRNLVIQQEPGKVIKHGDLKYVPSEGMPQHKNPFNKGNLIFQFIVNFPSKISGDKVKALESCLPGRVQPIIPDDSEECDLQDYEESRHRYSRARNGGGNIYEDDGGAGGLPGMGGMGGQRVECAHQ